MACCGEHMHLLDTVLLSSHAIEEKLAKTFGIPAVAGPVQLQCGSTFDVLQ